MSKSGVDSLKVMAELRRLERQSPAVVEHGLGVWAENLVSEMKQEGVCPRDTGRLRDSHGWSKVRAMVYRLFANTTYAAAVHERHPRQARWFQRTLNEAALRTLEKAVAAMRRKIGT